jgi:hypothetical protein
MAMHDASHLAGARPESRQKGPGCMPIGVVGACSEMPLIGHLVRAVRASSSLLRGFRVVIRRRGCAGGIWARTKGTHVLVCTAGRPTLDDAIFTVRGIE